MGRNMVNKSIWSETCQKITLGRNVPAESTLGPNVYGAKCAKKSIGAKCVWGETWDNRDVVVGLRYITLFECPSREYECVLIPHIIKL